MSGTITAEHNEKPIVGAEVVLTELRRVTRTDGKGRFAFVDVPAGTWTLVVAVKDYANQSRHVQVPSDPIDFSLDLEFHEAPVVVTADADPGDALKVYQPTSTLGAHELERRGGASLGMTLQNEPGISTTNLGTAPARPVIRGLGGDRVLILEDGVRVGDVSSLSPDHAVAVNPTEADSVEVVRGPANLLYGSNAIGGAINVLNGEIPSRLFDRPGGSISGTASDNPEEFSGSADFEASAGPVAFRAGGSRSDADSFEFKDNTAGNSQFDFTSFHGGVSVVGAPGFAGVAYRDYEGDYGIPVSEEGEGLGKGERGVTIRLSQESYKLTGQLTRPFGPFTGARLQAVRRDYTHTEFEETGEAGTIFNLDTLEVRGDVTHRAVGRFSGTFGLWLLDGDFEAAGEEALLPEAQTRGYAGLFYEEVALGKVKLLFGGRYDRQSVDPRSSSLDERTFTGVSGALGAVVNPEGAWSIAGNVTRNFKAPAAEELFASGPHVATFSFEIGDPDLDEETSVGYDLSFRWKTKRFSGEVTGFRTDFSDFIFLEPTGVDDVDSGLEIARYTQADALFQGLEAHAHVELVEHLTLELVGDHVRATNEDTDEPLPRIPPVRAGLGVNWETDRFGVGGEARYASEQDRVARDPDTDVELETPTDAYTIYNAFAHVQFPSGRLVHRFAVRGENLTDRLYRNHVSLVKDIVPQPGRSARLTYSLLY